MHFNHFDGNVDHKFPHIEKLGSAAQLIDDSLKKIIIETDDRFEIWITDSPTKGLESLKRYYAMTHPNYEWSKAVQPETLGAYSLKRPSDQEFKDLVN